jgi:hypothetical protein
MTRKIGIVPVLHRHDDCRALRAVFRVLAQLVGDRL